VEEYLRGCVGFDIEDNAIATILEDRGIAPGTPSKELTRKQKELCKADLYMWCASTPSIKGSVEEAHGTWKHKEGSTESSAYDKRNLRIMANEIYKKYGENVAGSTIKLHARGMRLWPRR
jgi:hypothetical protein